MLSIVQTRRFSLYVTEERVRASATIMVKRNKNESIKEQKYFFFLSIFIHMDELSIRLSTI